MILRAAVILWLGLSGSALATGRGIGLLEELQVDGQPLYTESHALLVGVSDYRGGWPDLESVPRELAQVQAALESQGFDVVTRLDPDADGLKDAFEGFINQYGYDPDNRLLFFFAGHGHTWEDANQGYLVPADAPRPATDTGDPGPAFLRKALHMSQILAWSRQMTAKHALFLFDSCFSGTVFKTRSLPTHPPHISRATTETVRQFITAGSAGEEVPARSVFTPAFVDALTFRWGDLNGDGYITGMELGLYLQAKVPEHARQSPQFGKHPDYHLSRGDFLFAVDAVPGLPPLPATPPPQPTQPVPPPPPPVRFLGNVQVNVNVSAEVFFDGQPAGTAHPDSPLNRHGVPAGALTVRVTAEGHVPAEQSVTVRRGQWEQLVFQLEAIPRQAKLTVRSNVYGDSVYIDGESKGSTRLDIDLEPGPRVVRVTKPGYVAYEKRLELVAGDEAVVWAELAPVADTRSTRGVPGPVHPDAPAVVEASDAAACLADCDDTLAGCRERRPDVAAQCREQAERECQADYDECRNDPSLLVFGAVSAESECLGRFAACERRTVAACQRAATPSAVSCEEQGRQCRSECGQ